jgi:hypothetical protein
MLLFLGGFYWVLGNIHPKYRSALKALHLSFFALYSTLKNME